ncbi:MAG: hypothetical protein E7276_11810 [Pseudobutyrivibrio sp.]|nr:hypothetical protein [Pseudobutyrivibrio sp.]
MAPTNRIRKVYNLLSTLSLTQYLQKVSSYIQFLQFLFS